MLPRLTRKSQCALWSSIRCRLVAWPVSGTPGPAARVLSTSCQSGNGLRVKHMAFQGGRVGALYMNAHHCMNAHCEIQYPAGDPPLRGSLTAVNVLVSRSTAMAWTVPEKSMSSKRCPRATNAARVRGETSNRTDCTKEVLVTPIPSLLGVVVGGRTVSSACSAAVMDDP
jgi:hypothetical protein